MRRPPTPTPVLFGPEESEDDRERSVTVSARNRDIVCVVESLTMDVARIRSPMALSISERITITFAGMPPITGVVLHVQAHDLMNDVAEVELVEVDAPTRLQLGAFVSKFRADNTEFEGDEDQVTQRRSVTNLDTSNLDLDPPTLRKDK